MAGSTQSKVAAFFNFRQVNPARSLALLGIGAALGLAIAGVGLFTAPGTSTLIVPPEDVASVNQRSISRIDFTVQLRAQYDVGPSEATPEQRRKVLDDMIREELFVQRGLELDVAGIDPSVRAAIVSAVEEQIVADVLTRQPTEADLRAYYDKHQSKYSNEGRMTVFDLVTQSSQEAEAAVRALREREPVAAVAARFGMRDSGRVKGEEFYFAAKIHLGDPLFALAQRLQDGEISDRIPMPDGFHVLAMIKNIKPLPVTFAAAYNEVLSDWRSDGGARLLAEDEVFLRKRANIIIAKDLR